MPGEPPADDYTRALLYGAIGSALALLGSQILAALPSGDSIRESSFYMVGKLTLANFVDGAGSIAGPLAVVAGLLLLTNAVLWLAGRRDGLTAAVCVAQPVIGVVAVGGAAIPWVVLLAAIALNLLIYALIAIFIIGFVISLLAGAFDD